MTNKILFIANARIPTEKAHGYQIVQMCQQFVRQGIELTLLLPRRFNKIKSTPLDYYKLRENIKIVKLANLDLIGKIPHLGYWLQIITFVTAIRWYLLRNDFDYIYTRDFHLIQFLPSKKNIILELHQLPKNKNKIRKIFPKLNKIIVLTNCLKSELENLGYPNRDILVAPDAVDLSLFEGADADKYKLRQVLSLPAKRKIVTYAGKFKTMGRGKGVENLILSIKNLQNKYDDIFLLLVGVEDSERPILEKLLIGCQSYKMVQHVAIDQLAKYELASDILIMNYPNELHYRCYMSPLKMFEYMASGQPIIASDLPAVRDILNEENAVLLPDDDHKTLSIAIEKLLSQPDKGEILARQARSDVRKYTWENRAKNILAFIE